MAQIGASRSVAVHMLGKLKTAVQMVAIPFLLYDGTLFGVIDTRFWGTGADLRRRGADDLVDGVLPAQGAAGNPRQGAVSGPPRRRRARRRRTTPRCARCRGCSCCIWSTGFVVARYGMPHAPPFGFLCLRYALSMVCFAAWIAVARAAWPRGGAQWRTWPSPAC